MKTVETKIRVGKKGEAGYQEIPISYRVPENDQEFQSHIAKLSGAELTKAHNDYVRGFDLSVRAAERPDGPSVPVYTMKGKGGAETDLRTLPVAKLVAGINAAYAAAFTGKVARAIQCTRAWLLAEGKAVEKDGNLVAKTK